MNLGSWEICAGTHRNSGGNSGRKIGLTCLCRFYKTSIGFPLKVNCLKEIFYLFGCACEFLNHFGMGLRKELGA